MPTLPLVPMMEPPSVRLLVTVSALGKGLRQSQITGAQ